MNHIVQKVVSTVHLKKGSKIQRNPENSASDDEGCIYSIDSLNLGRTSNSSYINSDWLLVNCREIHMADKINIMLSDNNDSADPVDRIILKPLDHVFFS